MRMDMKTGRSAMRWALLAALGVVAIAYYVMPSRAENSGGWTAELWTLEEGEALVASVSIGSGEGDEIVPTLALMCADKGAYNLRYDAGPQPDDSMDWTGQSATFEFSAGGAHVERELDFEALDGMWATTVAITDPLVRLIEANSELVVLMPNGGVGANTFTLKGSSRAIAQMRASC